MITQRDHPNQDGEIGTTPLRESGEDELQQPDAGEPGPAETGYTEPAYAAWLDAIGELTEPQQKFITNTLREYGETELLRALGAAKARINAGTVIERPAAYIKHVLQNAHYAVVDAAETKRKRSKGAPDWNAIAAEYNNTPAQIDRPEPSAPAGLREWLVAQGRVEATPEERARLEEDTRLRREQEMLDRERERQAAALAAEKRQMQEIAVRIEAATGSKEMARCIAEDFMRDVTIRQLIPIRLDALSQAAHKAGRHLDETTARKLLLDGSLGR